MYEGAAVFGVSGDGGGVPGGRTYGIGLVEVEGVRVVTRRYTKVESDDGE